MRSILSAVAILILLPGLSLASPAQTQGKVSGVRTSPATGSAGRTGPATAADTVLTRLDPSHAVEAIASSFVQEDVEAFMAFLPRAEIPFELGLETNSPRKGDREIRRSRQQIFYLLQDFFEKMEIEDAHFEPSSEEEGPGDLHGILQLSFEDSSSRRLYLHLRRMKGRWKVAELRALP